MADGLIDRIQAAAPEDRAYLEQFIKLRRKGRWPSVAEMLATSAHVSPETGCFVWTGSKSRGGYGQITIGKTHTFRAHRVAWELFWARKIPAGLVVDHLCRNPPCVNPAHLRVVTPRENTLCGTAPSALAAKRDLCPQGHPYKQRKTGRACPTCQKLWSRAYRRRRAEVRHLPLPSPRAGGEK